MIEIYEQTAIALFFIMALIVAFAYVYKKRQKSSGLINLVAYQSLGQKMGIAAIRIKNEILVLGITQSDIKLLKRLDENESGLDDLNNMAENVKRLKRLKGEV